VFPYQLDSSRANSAPSLTQARKPGPITLIVAGLIPYSHDFRRIRIYKPFRRTGAGASESRNFGKVSGKGINRTAKSSPETIVGKVVILKKVQIPGPGLTKLARKQWLKLDMPKFPKAGTVPAKRANSKVSDDKPMNL